MSAEDTVEEVDAVERAVEKRTLIEALHTMHATRWHWEAIGSIWHTAGYKHAMETIKGWKGEQR